MAQHDARYSFHGRGTANKIHVKLVAGDAGHSDQLDGRATDRDNDPPIGDEGHAHVGDVG